MQKVGHLLISYVFLNASEPMQHLQPSNSEHAESTNPNSNQAISTPTATSAFDLDSTLIGSPAQCGIEKVFKGKLIKRSRNFSAANTETR
jgi:hypothetical protein